MRASIRIYFTDVTLVSEDTHGRLYWCDPNDPDEHDDPDDHDDHGDHDDPSLHMHKSCLKILHIETRCG